MLFLVFQTLCAVYNMLLQAVRCLYSKVWSHRQAAISLATRRIMKSFGGPANTLSLEDPEATAVRGVTKLNISAVAREEEAELDIPIIPGASAKVFMQLSSMIEHGLSDSVAAVLHCLSAVVFVIRRLSRCIVCCLRFTLLPWSC